MLSVSSSLALVAAMLFGILLPGHHKEVDEFNGQTHEPIPMGIHDLVSVFLLFNGTHAHLFLRMWATWVRDFDRSLKVLIDGWGLPLRGGPRSTGGFGPDLGCA
jgi:hypothetical protein